MATASDNFWPSAWKLWKAIWAAPTWEWMTPTRKRLGARLDLVVNSSGLTDFNPDLREALDGNVAAPMHLLEFIRFSDHAALLHLSTCYVVGKRDGRVREEAHPNYTPAGVADFNAEHEWKSLDETIRNVEARAEGAGNDGGASPAGAWTPQRSVQISGRRSG